MGGRTTGPLTLPPGSLEVLRRLAAEASPREACGLLFGEALDVTEVTSIRNVADGRSEFVMDPEELFVVLSSREDVLGSWHSHPRSTADLSEADLTGPPRGWVQVVVGTNGVAGYAATDHTVLTVVERP